MHDLRQSQKFGAHNEMYIFFSLTKLENITNQSKIKFQLCLTSKVTLLYNTKYVLFTRRRDSFLDLSPDGPRTAESLGKQQKL